MSPGSSTGRLGHSRPEHEKLAPTDSSSLPSWLRSLCCGKREGPSAELSGNPESEEKKNVRNIDHTQMFH